MKATSETIANRNTWQPHRKRTTPARKFHTSHDPMNHTQREPPYKDVQSAARMNLAALPRIYAEADWEATYFHLFLLLLS